MRTFDAVELKILWDRLVAITDQIVASLVRTSFSINVREGYDLSCILFDGRGRVLAQGTYSVPSFTGTAPQTIRTMLERFPPETLRPGDVLVTNDPELGPGHRRCLLPDVATSAGDTPDPEVPVTLGEAVYAVYTSGSTGEPKAAVNTHAGIANRFRFNATRILSPDLETRRRSSCCSRFTPCW